MDDRPFFEHVGPTDADILQNLAMRAGVCVLSHRVDGKCAVDLKADGSPVTAADHASQEIILDGLRRLDPSVPIISEEKDATHHLSEGGTFWMVDPLDGTRDFVSGGSEFTVNIGLVANGVPVLGVIYAPYFEESFYRDPRRQKFTCRGADRMPTARGLGSETAPLLLVNRSDERKFPLGAWCAGGLIRGWRTCSSAYKYGLMARGDADLYIRKTPCSEWDTAAGHALLLHAGGDVVTAVGDRLTYGKEHFLNPPLLSYAHGGIIPLLPPFFDAVNALAS